jgi:hypothetical protein
LQVENLDEVKVLENFHNTGKYKNADRDFFLVNSPECGDRAVY